MREAIREIVGQFQSLEVRPMEFEVVASHHCCSCDDPMGIFVGNWGHPLPSLSWVAKAVQRFLRRASQRTPSALAWTMEKFGSKSAARIPRIIKTTTNSTIVKARPLMESGSGCRSLKSR
jgi:hypothetical protein